MKKKIILVTRFQRSKILDSKIKIILFECDLFEQKVFAEQKKAQDVIQSHFSGAIWPSKYTLS